MSDNFYDIGLFHEKFGLHNVTFHDAGPQKVDQELFEFRFKFLAEELEELQQAWKAQDSEEIFDALLDLVVVAMGTAHLFGFPWQEGWDEVQRANMSKVRAKADGSDSKRGSSWDIVKPEGWTPPDHAPILRKYGFRV